MHGAAVAAYDKMDQPAARARGHGTGCCEKAGCMGLFHLQGLIFDWDGTIVDSAQAMFLSYRHAYKQNLGITFPRDESDFRRLVPMRLAESSARYGGTQAAAVAGSYNRYYEQEGYKTCRVYAGVREMLAELRRRGYALGVASNKGRGRIGADIAFLGLDGCFDVLVTSEDTAERKPHPAPLLKAAQQLGLAPAALAYAGDYRGDIIAAHAAGMVAIAVGWGGIFPLDSLQAAGPDYMVGDPAALLALCPAPVLTAPR
jgi:HAD superfamily hydrolase (TIGR01509 family)